MMMVMLADQRAVDRVFKRQRRLTLSCAAVFFLLVLAIPWLAGQAEWWYARPVWGGLTPNFLVVGILLHVGYWLLGLWYTVRANRLEDELWGRAQAAGRQRELELEARLEGETSYA